MEFAAANQVGHISIGARHDLVLRSLLGKC
jgi:hypothetical protein